MSRSIVNILGYKGLKERDGYLYICFKYDGKLRTEPTGLAKNKTNLTKLAKRLIAFEVMIERNQFVYLDEFPNSSYANKAYGGPGSMLYEDVAEDWWVRWKADNYHMSRATVSQYEGIFNDHIKVAFAGRKIDTINSEDIADWQRDLKSVKPPYKSLGDVRVRSIAVHMGRVFTYAYGRKLTAENVFTQFAALKKSLSARTSDGLIEGLEPFTQDEINKILSVIPDHQASERNLIQFNVSMGLRIGEVLALTWDDIDLEAGTVRVNRKVIKTRYELAKYNSHRILPLSAMAIKALKDQKQLMLKTEPFRLIVEKSTRKDGSIETEDHGIQRIVFFNSNSNKVYGNSNLFSDKWSKFLAAAGVDNQAKNGRGRGPNHLRHTFATESLIAGVPVQAISEALGHKSQAVTLKHYAKYIPERKKMGQALFDQAGWSL